MSDIKAEEKRETSTELLIRVTEYFSDDEPVDVIVCYVTETGKLWVQDNGVDQLKAVGMLDTAKQGFFSEMLANEDEEGGQ